MAKPIQYYDMQVPTFNYVQDEITKIGESLNYITDKGGEIRVSDNTNQMYYVPNNGFKDPLYQLEFTDEKGNVVTAPVSADGTVHIDPLAFIAIMEQVGYKKAGAR